MPRPQDIPAAELNTRKWGASGKGLARINGAGEIEVYDEQAADTSAPAAPAPTPPAAPAPAAGGPSPMSSLQAAADPGAGWMTPPEQASVLKPGLGTSVPPVLQRIFSGRIY